MNSMRLAIMVTILFAVGCAGPESGGATSPSHASADEVAATAERRISCADAYQRDTPIGRLTNNVWNKQAVNGAPYEQCLLVRGGEQSEQYGWSWDWPADSDVVLAFPEVVFGWKPWNGGRSSTVGLPAALDDLAALRLAYDAEIDAQGRQIFSIAVWLTGTGATSVEPNSADITADVNIWLDGSAFEPSGQRIAETNIDGSAYGIWHAADMGDASGANAAKWTHVVYRSKLPQHRGAIDIKKILDDAVERKLLSRSEYVSSIEIGNEVMSGRGRTWIRELALAIER